MICIVASQSRNFQEAAYHQYHFCNVCIMRLYFTSADKKASTNSRSLWISGLSNSTKAGDLKTLFSKNGKVTGAKIVTNTKDPCSKCYGFVTMSSAEEASKCIQHLHRTELHGKMISVERVSNTRC